MKEMLEEILKEQKLDFDTVEDEDLQIFCKNSNNLEVTNIRSFEEELKSFQIEEEFAWDVHDPEANILWYILTRCFEEYRDEKGHYPGLCDHNEDSNQAEKDKTETEFKAIKAKADVIVEKLTPGQTFNEKYLRELLRFSDSQVHTISSFIGGVAS